MDNNETAAPATQAEAAIMQSVLVSLEFGLPRQCVELKTEAKLVEVQNNAKAGTVKASLYYFRSKQPDAKGKLIDRDGLKPLRDFQSAWKRATIARFAPYPFGGGFYLLPGALVAAYKEECTKFLDKKEEVWVKWADEEYPHWFSTRKERMGDLTGGDKFPSLGECREAFTCEDTMVQLAPSQAWKRISALTPDLVKEMEAKTEGKVKEAIAAAQRGIWEDVLAPIQKIIDTLSKPQVEGKKATPIHDTLIGNVLAIVDLVPAMNLENDPNLAALAQQAKDIIGSIKPDDIRKSVEVKADLLAKAKALVTTFTPLARRIVLPTVVQPELPVEEPAQGELPVAEVADATIPEEEMGVTP